MKKRADHFIGWVHTCIRSQPIAEHRVFKGSGSLCAGLCGEERQSMRTGVGGEGSRLDICQNRLVGAGMEGDESEPALKPLIQEFQVLRLEKLFEGLDVTRKFLAACLGNGFLDEGLKREDQH